MKHYPDQTPSGMRKLRQGFALVATLAVLVMVVVLAVAFAAVMRSDRRSSSYFLESERAQALAEGALNRVIASYAAPELSAGNYLKPYADEEYFDEDAQLPKSSSPYLKNPLDDGEEGWRVIYGIDPAEGIDTENHLVMLSRSQSGGQADAYLPSNWAYMGMQDADATFVPKNRDGELIAPQWIDYYETLPDGSRSPYPIGQIAFTIWNDSGKFDINMAGSDSEINGLAPYDLRLEEAMEAATDLVAALDGPNGRRDRSNFSLRAIKPNSDSRNKTGDDRWFFSLKDILAQNLAVPAELVDFSTWSRDFEIRPEWDGNRGPETARHFLKSFINNPMLFELFQSQEVGPDLVLDTLDQTRLLAALPDSLKNGADRDNWLEVMRLLATLRRVLPPHVKTPAVNGSPVAADVWSDNDIWGIALNIIQASATPSDQNLFAYNNKAYPGAPYLDEHSRYGIRIAPLLTEVALRMIKTGESTYEITEFIKIWNPYDVEMLKPDGSPIRYIVGEQSGSQWPLSNTALWRLGDDRSRKFVEAPRPGQFRVIELEKRVITTSQLNNEQEPRLPGNPKGFWIRHRPFIMNADYFPVNSQNAVPIIDTQALIMVNPWNQGAQMRSYIHSDRMPDDIGDVAWYSWQIDDPRMACFSQYHPQVVSGYLANPNSNRNSQESPTHSVAAYSWQGFLNKHAIPTMKGDGFYAGRSFLVDGEAVDGFNIPFGENFPGGISTQRDFDRAMETFALPGRPFANLGELGGVFANRPWRTLNIGATIVPDDPRVAPGNEWGQSPMAFLDYFTTLGTETDDRRLNYIAGGAQGPQKISAHFNARKQGLRWLFESVSENSDNEQIPAGNLRPVRGRVNLNHVRPELLARLLSAPYRVPSSLGLKARTDLKISVEEGQIGFSDLKIEVDPEDARVLADAIVKIRPLRALSDLAKLEDSDGLALKHLRAKYSDAVINAIMGRLAHWGTVRQQIYTIDICARVLNREIEKRRASGENLPPKVMAEAGLRAKVYFDTFSREVFVESMESWTP